MGHYDEYREEHYAEQRRQSNERAAAAIPRIVKRLDEARTVLAQNAQDIKFSTHIEGEIELHIALLNGQLK